ncbi:MAG: AMP-binding protein [Bacteroidota bacterium]
MNDKSLNISALFFQTAEQSPNVLAICDGDQQRTFGQFAAEVRATAAYFRELGIGKGDRVLIFVPMGLDLYRVVMAVFQIGATAVFLDEWVSLDRLRLCCRLADCKAFIANWKFRLIGWFISEIRQIPIKPKLTYNLDNQYTGIENCAETDTALITFTTGSTGAPKAADRTHQFLRFQFEALIREIKPKPGDVVMTTLPIVLLVNFGTGACSVVARFSPKKAHLLNPATVLNEIKQHGVKTLIASPYFVRKISESAAEKPEASTLEHIFTGGAPVFPTEAALYRRAFPQSAITIVYGSTESEPISSISADQLLQHNLNGTSGGLCVGAPDAHLQLRILEIQNVEIQENALESMSLPQGQIGEITVAGDHVLKAYYNNEKAFRRNKITDADGTIWHRTGDAGYLGSNGNLYLTGRCYQMIRREGRWISPFIWESLLAESGLVQCGAILEINGALVLVVQALEGMPLPAESELRALFPEKIDQIRFLKKIPMDPRHHSKIDYEALRLNAGRA